MFINPDKLNLRPRTSLEFDWPHAYASSRTLATLFLLTLIAIFLLRDIHLLARYAVAVGIDGYYYVLQIESLQTQGSLFFETLTPVDLYVLKVIQALTNNSVVTLKLGALVFHLLLCLGVYAVLKSLTNDNLYSLGGVLIAGASSVHLFLLSEFVGNLAGLSLLIWTAYFALVAKQKRSVLAIAGSGLCALLAIFSHRSSVFLLTIFAASMVLWHWLTFRHAWPFRKPAFYVLVVILFLTPRFLAAQSIVVLPDWLSSQLLPLPRVATLGHLALPEKVSLLMTAVSFFVITRRNLDKDSLTFKFLGGIATMSLLLTLNPFLNRDAGWLSIAERLSAIVYVQLAILAPAVFWISIPVLKRWTIPACLILPIGFSTISLQVELPWGLRDEFLSQRMQLIGALTTDRPALAEVQRVIAPHGDQFLVTYALGVPSQQKWVSSQEGKTYWLLKRFPHLDLENNEGLIVLDRDHGILLVNDDDLDVLLSSLGALKIRRLLPLNPHLTERLLSPNTAVVNTKVHAPDNFRR